MGRRRNDNRTTTPVMIDKTLKNKISRLRNEDKNRKGYESDNTVLTRIVERYMQEHANEVHEPKETYTSKSS